MQKEEQYDQKLKDDHKFSINQLATFRLGGNRRLGRRVDITQSRESRNIAGVVDWTRQHSEAGIKRLLDLQLETSGYVDSKLRRGLN
jgi:hypothetical protein